MRKLLFYIFSTFLIIISSLNIYSQNQDKNNELDSLLDVLKRMPDNDDKVENLLEVTEIYFNSNSDSALKYAELALDLSQQIAYAKGKADAYYLKSMIFWLKSDYPSSLKMNSISIAICDSIKDSLKLGRAYYHQGSLNMDLGKYDSANFYYHKSLAIFKLYDKPIGLYSNYDGIAIVFREKSEYDSAMYYFLKAAKICEANNDESNLATIFNNLGWICKTLGQFDDAIRYVNKSLEINRRNNFRYNYALDIQSLGEISIAQDSAEKALKYFKEAEPLMEKIGNTRSIYDLYNNMALAYQNLKNYDLAIKYYTKALSGFNESNILKGSIITMGNLSSLYEINGQPNKALKMQDSVVSLSIRHGLPDYQLGAYFNISHTYRNLGNYKRAYEYLAKYNSLRDSLFNLEKTKMINDLKLKYEREKDQGHILRLQNENKQKELDLQIRTSQRNSILFIALGGLLLIIFIFIYIRQKNIKDKIIADQKILQLEEEKKMMAAKILVEGQEKERKRIAQELHDGLGVLLSTTKIHFATIRDKSPENQALIDKATKMLEQATGDVRKISHNMMPGLLTKLGFFEAVEELFENLEEMEGLNVECQVLGKQFRFDENREIMLYRVIQEIVNNSLKHADAKNITMHIRIMEDNLDISYSDDGKGFDLEEINKNSSIGLKSIQSRLDFLNGQMTVITKPGEGVGYSLNIPIIVKKFDEN